MKALIIIELDIPVDDKIGNKIAEAVRHIDPPTIPYFNQEGGGKVHITIDPVSTEVVDYITGISDQLDREDVSKQN